MVNFFDPNYFEDPHAFKPERFISGKEVEVLKNNPFLFTPFWVGPRSCIGQHMAMTEAKMLLGLFLSNFDYEFADKKYEMILNTKTGYGPDQPIKYKLTPK
mmetsp:Transcript_19400/g.16619  ORF Transcript_19400/g.16619 Transcript_19400/m.16619 type:complete len:101 (+) Transcript_19400:1287-1589(+)